ncbi:COA6 factor, partial [Pseudoatta argentina]
MSFPNKEDRIKCWSRRDEYWQCLDEGKSQAECIEFRKQYEKFCPSQWVKHFDRKRDYLKFKEQIETGGTCLDGGMQSSKRSDLPKQVDKKSQAVLDFEMADKNLQN